MRVIGVPWHFEPDGNGDWRKVYDVIPEKITNEERTEEAILLDNHCHNSGLHPGVHSSCSRRYVNGTA